MIYTLTKMSSGDCLELKTNNFYILSRTLEACCCCCCTTCVAEAIEDCKEEDSDEDYFYNLLFTSCGAEFYLKEEDEEN